MIKLRDQNVTTNDTVALQLLVLNSNNFADLNHINEVRIYFLDRNAITSTNPQGRVLIETIPGTSINHIETGRYELDLYLDPALYTETGRYIDEWDVIFTPTDPAATIDQLFQIYSQLWFTTPLDIVYDFNFYFQPNKIRFGSKRFIDIEITSNTPTATDLAAYYENLAIAAQLFITIKQRCGECLPCESDLRVLVDNAPVLVRQKNRGFYFLDTTLFDCGIFDVWFQLSLGNSVYVSDTNQLQIYS